MPSEVLEVWHAGGFVMPPLVLVSFLMWWTLAWRWMTLRGVDLAAVKRLNHDDAEVRLEQHRLEVDRGNRMVVSLVAVAPLLGLLGTVTGMIETFDSLATMSLFSQSGGIAGGVAQALFTTQMGLVVAIPGLVIGRLQASRQVALEGELDALVELVAQQESGVAA